MEEQRVVSGEAAAELAEHSTGMDAAPEPSHAPSAGAMEEGLPPVEAQTAGGREQGSAGASEAKCSACARSSRRVPRAGSEHPSAGADEDEPMVDEAGERAALSAASALMRGRLDTYLRALVKEFPCINLLCFEVNALGHSRDIWGACLLLLLAPACARR